LSSAMHIHVIDNKQVYYPNDNCPICGTSTSNSQQKAFVPNVHRKGNTIVLQTTKLQMITVTWYQKGNAFLMSMRKATRNNEGKVMRGQDGRPLWSQLTMRINILLTKQLIAELEKLIKELETTPTYTQPEVPKRA